MPKLRRNSLDVISIALSQTSISSQSGRGRLGDGIKTWRAQAKRFQFETGDPASYLSDCGTFNWMHLIQFSSCGRWNRERAEFSKKKISGRARKHPLGWKSLLSLKHPVFCMFLYTTQRYHIGSN